MTSRRKFLGASAGLATATLSSFLLPQGAQAQSSRGIVGRLAPEVYLDYWIDGDGNPTKFSVTDNTGKWIMLKCFQDWCPGCHSSGFPTLKAFADEFWGHPQVTMAGVQTVFEGHSVNTLDDVRKNQLRYELPIPMGHDPGNPDTHSRPQVMKNYRTGGTPWIIIIDPSGTVVFNDFHLNTEKLIEYVHQQIG